LKVSTLILIADGFGVPEEYFTNFGGEVNPPEIGVELNNAIATLEQLRKDYNELKAKYENLFKINSLNETIVEAMRKESVAKDKLMFLLHVQLNGLHAIAENHIKSLILMAHPEIDEERDSKLLKKEIDADPFNKEYIATMKLIEPLIDYSSYEKYMTDEHIFDEL